ncbi:MAG: hypothetical protein FWF90_17645 [Promicromonosporaceae bacterium]|nr:hypothetical protein [Promicromonosporaceae bacterium]
MNETLDPGGCGEVSPDVIDDYDATIAAYPADPRPGVWSDRFVDQFGPGAQTSSTDHLRRQGFLQAAGLSRSARPSGAPSTAARRRGAAFSARDLRLHENGQILWKPHKGLGPGPA